MTETTSVLRQGQETVQGLAALGSAVRSTYDKGKTTTEGINAIHYRIHNGKPITSGDIEALRTLYPRSLAQCQEQEKSIRKMLDKIYEMREIRSERARLSRQSGHHKESVRRGALMKNLLTSAQCMPVFMSLESGDTPPLCGATPSHPSYTANAGDMVAALTRGKEGANWILAEVVAFSPSSGRYELDDVDEEQEKKKLILSKRRVVPLPTTRANPATHPDALHAVDTVVMALYPQTTCFYKGIVVSVPGAVGDEYEVRFEDPDSYPDGYSPPLKVAQKYVIPVQSPK